MSDNVSLRQQQFCWSGPCEYSTDLKECADRYVDTRYSKLYDSDPQTYFVPGFVLATSYAGVFDGDGVPADKKDDIEAVRRGLEAEQKVLLFLQAFARTYPQPMVVFSGFQYNKFLYWLRHFPEEQPYLTTIPDKSQEIDTLIIHRHLGVIVLETKSKNDDPETKSKKRNRACKQLQAIAKLLRDCHFFSPALANRHPTLTVAHFNPNQDTAALLKAHKNGTCPGHLLDMSYHENEQKFFQWLQKLEADIPKGSLANNEFAYQTIVPRLICSHSVVDAYEGAARFVIRQECLEKSQQKLERAEAEDEDIQEEETAASESREPDGESKWIKTRVLKFLNPDQHSVWSGPRWQLITGPFGSGKTILIRHKALELLKHGQNVLVLTTYPISLEYKKFFKNNESDFVKSNGPTPIWHVVYFTAAGNHGDAYGDDHQHAPLDLKNLDGIFQLHKRKGSFNVFIDEVQGSRAMPFRKTERYSFSTRLTEVDEKLRKYAPGFYWIAVGLDSHSVVEEAISLTDQKISAVVHNEHAFDGAPHARHHRNQIKQCMRCTRPLYEFCFSTRTFFERYITNGRQDLEKFVQRMQNVDANQVSLGHSVEGPPFEHIERSTLFEAAEEALKKVEALVRLKELKVSQIECANEILRLKSKGKRIKENYCIYDPMQTLVVFGLMTADTAEIMKVIEWMIASLNQMGIPACHLADYPRNKDDTGTITVACECDYDFYSFEWHTVILVSDPYYLLMTPVVPTRAIMQLIWIEYKTRDWNCPQTDVRMDEIVVGLRLQETRFCEHMLRLGLLETGIVNQQALSVMQPWQSIISSCRAGFLPVAEIHGRLSVREDDKIVPTLAYALAYIATRGPDHIQLILDSGVLSILIPLLAHETPDIQAAVLLAVGSMALLGTGPHVKRILDVGVLNFTVDLLKHSDKWVQKLAVWLVGNIASKKVHNWETASENSFMHVILKIFEQDGFQSQSTEELGGWALTFMTINDTFGRILLDGQNTILRDAAARVNSILGSCNSPDLIIEKSKDSEAEQTEAMGLRLRAIIDQQVGAGHN